MGNFYTPVVGECMLLARADNKSGQYGTSFSVVKLLASIPRLSLLKKGRTRYILSCGDIMGS